MSENLKLYRGAPPDSLSEAVDSGALEGAVLLQVVGELSELTVVRPIVEDPGVTWTAALESFVSPSRGTVLGVVSTNPRLAAAVACDYASWTGDRGSNTVVVDGSIESPAVDKPLLTDGDEGLVDAIMFGVSPSAVARRTLAPGVRVVTTGSHPLSIDKALEPEKLTEFALTLSADVTCFILRTAYVQRTALALDAVIVVEDDPERLLSAARLAKGAGVERVFGALICESVPVAAPVAYDRAAVEPALEVEGQEPRRAETEREPAVEEPPDGTGVDSPFLPEGEPIKVVERPGPRRPRGRTRAIAAVLAAVCVAVVGWILLGPDRASEGPLSRPESADVDPGTAPVGTGPDAAGTEAEPTAGDAARPARRDGVTPASGQGLVDETRAPTESPSADEPEPLLERQAPGGGPESPADARAVDAAAESPVVLGASRELPLFGPGGPYVVYLSSHKIMSAAEREASEALGAGVTAVIIDADVEGSGTWHRVAVRGGYPTLAEARNTLDIVKELGYEGAWIARAPRVE